MSAQHRPLDLRRVRAVESGRGGGGGSGGGPSRECHQHLLGFLPNDVILGIFRYVGSLSLYTDAVAVSTFFRDHLTSPLAEELWKEFMEKDFRATSTSLGLQTQEVYLPGKFVPSSSTLSGIGALNVLLKPISLKTWRCLWARHQFRRRHLLGASIRTEATVYNADSQCLMMKYWSQMLRFVERHDCHGTIDTLQRGASAEDFERVKHFLGVPALHPDIVAFYSVCCGQAGALWSEDALFGGYRVYDRVENTRLAPLLFSAGYPLHSPTLPLDGLFSMMKRHQCIVLAFTAGFGHIVVVDAVTAKVTHLNPGSSSAFPLDPDDSAGNDSSGDTMPQPEKKEKRQSQLMRWIGKFAHGVDSGLYECDVLMNSKGASRFPVFGPGTTVAVTRGFRVHLSTIFECLSQNWVYRLRIRLLSPEEPGGLSTEERGFQTAQLSRRHWSIRSPTSEANSPAIEVDGEGVVGWFPLFGDQGVQCLDKETPPSGDFVPEFSYTSQTGGFDFDAQDFRSTQGKTRGSFGGFLTLVPGTLENPTGPPFRIDVKPVPLYIPEVVL